ncbi:hypothetical protein [Streptomyces sp. NPDC005322]|uniref:hypothetical protein n=1 Tax=unclassified Streptomyces TaxID=2593676 RepID=UPI0033B7A226
MALSTAALCAAAPAALADHRHSGAATIRVSRNALAPGADVEVRVFGCPSEAATVSSPVFVDDAQLTPDGDALFSEATIRSTAKVGTHLVTVDCGGAPAYAGEGDDEAKGEAKGKVVIAVERPPSPVPPVHAGGGGTAPAEGRLRDDFGGAEAYGLVLSGGTALAVGALAVQRRRRRPSAGTGAG